MSYAPLPSQEWAKAPPQEQPAVVEVAHLPRTAIPLGLVGNVSPTNEVHTETLTREVRIDAITPLVLAFVGLAGVWPCAIVSLFLSAKNWRKMGGDRQHRKFHLVRLARIVAGCALGLWFLMLLVGLTVALVEFYMWSHH